MVTTGKKMSDTESHTRRVVFSGRVQGVGFRWTTQNLAKTHPVTGFVRNLPDGRVELMVQGRSQDTESLLRDIQNHFADNISDVDQSEIDEPAEFADFSIRR